MSTSSSPEQGTPGVQPPHPDAGTHTVSLQRDVEVCLVPVGHENGDEDYHVYLEPVSDDDPALGTVMPHRPDGLWYVHLAPRYGDGAVATVGGLDLALRRLLELALDEDINPKHVEIPSRDDAAEEPEDEGERLRDHVHVGLDIPIQVYKVPSTDTANGVEWWYYVHVELLNGAEDCVGLVEHRDYGDGNPHWAGLAEPGYGTVCHEDTQQGAIDALVRYSLEQAVKLRERQRSERII